MAAVILYGRPPFLPRALAAARPAIVRSEMSARSNSARAAKIPKTSFPDAVVVSMAVPSPVRTFNPIPLRKVAHRVDEVTEIAAEPIELPHQKGVAVAEPF